MGKFTDALKHIVSTIDEGMYGDVRRQAQMEREKIMSEQAARALDDSRFEELKRSNMVREGQTDRSLGQGDERIAFGREEAGRDQGNQDRRFGLSEKELSAQLAAQKASEAFQNARIAQGNRGLGLQEKGLGLQEQEMKNRQSDREAGRKNQVLGMLGDIFEKEMQFAGGDEEKMAAIEQKAMRTLMQLANSGDPEAIQLVEQEKAQPGFFKSFFETLKKTVFSPGNMSEFVSGGGI